MKLDEIKMRYDIDSNSPEEIRVELRKKIKENHPDTNSDYNSEYFNQLIEDFDYVDRLIKGSGSNETLIPVSEFIRSLAEVLQVPAQKEENQKEHLEKELSVNIEHQISTIKNRKRVSKYSSASIMAIITFIWLFPQRVYEHPFAQIIFGDTNLKNFTICVTMIWFMALLYFVVYWFKTVRFERIEKDIVNRVKLESVQNEIFMHFLDNVLLQKQFTKLHFIDYLSHAAKIKAGVPYFRRFQLQEEVIQSMADIILLRAKEYGVIRAIKSNGLIECYEVISDDK